MTILKIAAISLLPGIGVIGGFFFWCLCRCNAQLGGLSYKYPSKWSDAYMNGEYDEAVKKTKEDI